MRHILTAILALEISLAMTFVPLGTKIWVANDLNDVFHAVGTIYVFLLLPHNPYLQHGLELTPKFSTNAAYLKARLTNNVLN